MMNENVFFRLGDEVIIKSTDEVVTTAGVDYVSYDYKSYKCSYKNMDYLILYSDTQDKQGKRGTIVNGVYDKYLIVELDDSKELVRLPHFALHKI